MMIKCSRCGVVKSETEFYVRPQSKTGFETQCKDCCRLRQREYGRSRQAARHAYYEKTRTARLATGSEYRKKHADAIAAKTHEYEEKHPERIQAGRAVREAIKRKEILPARKCKCAGCGKKAAHLHHESYAPDQWLAVVPLCRSCHKLRHMSSKV